MPGIRPLPFYLAYMGAIGAYVALGGMAATAFSEAFQGVLVVVLSLALIPAGLHQVGGLAALRTRVAPAMFSLFGSAGDAQFTWYSVLAILFVSVIQINANISNMPVHGSARDEYATRFGAVSGTYGKRLMIIVWGMVGLIALGLYQGNARLADPDSAWGLHVAAIVRSRRPRPHDRGHIRGRHLGDLRQGAGRIGPVRPQRIPRVVSRRGPNTMTYPRAAWCEPA